MESASTEAERKLSLAVRNIHDAAVELATERGHKQTANELAEAISILERARKRTMKRSVEFAA